MSDLTRTNLVVVASPLPPDFEGDLQDFFDALIERMSVQSPSGLSTIVEGDVEPSSNVGPWLKNGDRWYVFSDADGRYVPANIDDSVTQVYVVSDTEPDAPGTGDPSIWLRTVGSRVIAWYFWTGAEWRPGGNRPPSGPTASRPTSPVDYEQYWDTDINCLIHFERGSWRTVSGTPGDVKFVTTPTLSAALTANPGWQYAGQDNLNWRGRVIGIATKDPGATPETAYPTGAGITSRAQADEVGEETHILASDEIEQHSHVIGAATLLNSDNNAYFQRVDDGETISVPGPRPPNYFELRGDGTTNGTKNGTMPDPAAGTCFITSRQFSLAGVPNYTAAAEAHENMQPTVFLWALVKT